MMMMMIPPGMPRVTSAAAAATISSSKTKRRRRRKKKRRRRRGGGGGGKTAPLCKSQLWQRSCSELSEPSMRGVLSEGSWKGCSCAVSTSWSCLSSAGCRCVTFSSTPTPLLSLCADTAFHLTGDFHRMTFPSDGSDDLLPAGEGLRGSRRRSLTFFGVASLSRAPPPHDDHTVPFVCWPWPVNSSLRLSMNVVAVQQASVRQRQLHRVTDCREQNRSRVSCRSTPPWASSTQRLLFVASYMTAAL